MTPRKEQYNVLILGLEDKEIDGIHEKIIEKSNDKITPNTTKQL